MCADIPVCRMLAAHHAACKEIDAQRLHAEPRADQNRRSSRNRRIRSQPIMGHVALHAEERVKVNVQGPFPAIQAANVGIKRIRPQPAVSEESVVIAKLSRRRTRQRQKNSRSCKNEDEMISHDCLRCGQHLPQATHKDGRPDFLGCFGQSVHPGKRCAPGSPFPPPGHPTR